MSERVYRVAVLGCRGRGTAAARAYHEHPRTEVVALCDLLPERLQQLGDELGVAARYDDYGRMIAAEGPDIVAIPTGTEFHYPLAMGVLEHGVHIDIEKPLCQGLDEADRVLELAAAQGVRVAVHHQGRTGGAMRAVRAALDAGRIGTPRLPPGSGKGYDAGYGLMNIGAHTVRNTIGLAGHVRGVGAHARSDRRPGPPAGERGAVHYEGPGDDGSSTGESRGDEDGDWHAAPSYAALFLARRSRPRSRGSSTSRRASPSMLNP